MDNCGQLLCPSRTIAKLNQPPSLRVPAATAMSAWIPDFLGYCFNNSFVSTHLYPGHKPALSCLTSYRKCGSQLALPSRSTSPSMTMRESS